MTLCSDLSLVLSIDASGSIDNDEFSIQIRGYAAAFRNREVLRAMRDTGTVDLGAVVWGDADVVPQVPEWQRIINADDAETFARHIDGIRRRVAGNTGLGAGVAAAIDLLENGSRCTGRKVINVSGDGRDSNAARPRRSSPPLAHVRQRARDLDITINGLAIIDLEPDLAEYDRERLIFAICLATARLVQPAARSRCSFFSGAGERWHDGCGPVFKSNRRSGKWRASFS